MDVRTQMRSAANDNDILHWAADLMIKERTASLFMVPIILKRHVSGLRPDRGTTYCDDGSLPLPVAQLQIRDEDNNTVQPARSKDSADDVVILGDFNIHPPRWRT